MRVESTFKTLIIGLCDVEKY